MLVGARQSDTGALWEEDPTLHAQSLERSCRKPNTSGRIRLREFGRPHGGWLSSPPRDARKTGYQGMSW
jgi:hypothetical protein